jgi:hypothetical protein
MKLPPYVYASQRRHSYQSRVTLNGKSIYVGSFPSALAAYQALQETIKEHDPQRYKSVLREIAEWEEVLSQPVEPPARNKPKKTTADDLKKWTTAELHKKRRELYFKDTRPQLFHLIEEELEIRATPLKPPPAPEFGTYDAEHGHLGAAGVCRSLSITELAGVQADLERRGLLDVPSPNYRGFGFGKAQTQRFNGFNKLVEKPTDNATKNGNHRQ